MKSKVFLLLIFLYGSSLRHNVAGEEASSGSGTGTGSGSSGDSSVSGMIDSMSSAFLPDGVHDMVKSGIGEIESFLPSYLTGSGGSDDSSAGGSGTGTSGSSGSGGSSSDGSGSSGSGGSSSDGSGSGGNGGSSSDGSGSGGSGGSSSDGSGSGGSGGSSSDGSGCGGGGGSSSGGSGRTSSEESNILAHSPRGHNSPMGFHNRVHSTHIALLHGPYVGHTGWRGFRYRRTVGPLASYGPYPTRRSAKPAGSDAGSTDVATNPGDSSVLWDLISSAVDSFKFMYDMISVPWGIAMTMLSYMMPGFFSTFPIFLAMM